MAGSSRTKRPGGGENANNRNRRQRRDQRQNRDSVSASRLSLNHCYGTNILIMLLIESKIPKCNSYKVNICSITVGF